MPASETDQRRNSLHLRDVVDADLPLFFEFQMDPVANRMAAFTSKDPADRDAFDAHWAKITASEDVIIKTILHDEIVVGSVLSYKQSGEWEVSYWIGREYWGRGIATEALRRFLQIVETRPLYARAAKDNVGSIRVLEKCGFKFEGKDKGFANARGEETEEFILKLE
jgi:RimJ/RimL family protein N-acetyltransferase